MDRICEVLAARQPIVVTDHVHAAAFKRRIQFGRFGLLATRIFEPRHRHEPNVKSIARLQREQPAHSRVTGRTSPVGVWERLMGAKSFR